MTSLFDAFNNKTVSTMGRTHNGALTHSTSMSKCLDLFNMIGSSRGKDLSTQFDAALAENPEIAIRMLQWVRDCRGGAGEREMFRSLLRRLANRKEYREISIAILRKTPALGYWKDVIKLYNVDLFRPVVHEMVAVALAADDGLCAKYMPRKGPTAAMLRKALGLHAREYRKLLVSMSNTVEQKMCAKQWNDIDFNKIPSLASARYQKAFMRNAEKNYNAYISALEKGEAKINASVVYPYDVLKSTRAGVSSVANQQWKALPDYMEGSTERVLPMIDVSGSMSCITAISGLSCMDVAISLGLYLSERASGQFKDSFMTFSESPTFERVSGSLTERFRQISKANWGYRTDIQKTFELLLTQATRYKVPENEMPTMIVILSDMEFNRCSGRTAHDMMKKKYANAGYKLPKIIFWNLCARPSNNPVRSDENGTAMISGFSPVIMTSVLCAKDFDPYSMMLETLCVDKYSL